MNWSNYLNATRLRESERKTEKDPRNEFESDFGRVVFSPAIRRMHDKTQVFPLTTDDNIHSRLTHSMEVMAIGHSLGLRLSENEEFLKKTKMDKNKVLREIPVLLKNACLVHDIGNPPFGHFGETVIQNYFTELFKNKDYCFSLNELEKEDFEHFDGNAQGFRVLTKLQVLDDAFGLNLTYGTLASYLKYPNTNKIDKTKLAFKKRGVFQSEKKYLEIIAKECTLIKDGKYYRHPLAFLMEAADSICYFVMDIEDGFNKGWYNYDTIKKSLNSIEGMEEVFNYVETKAKSDINKVVSLRIALISRLVILAIDNFIKNYDAICEGSYNEELIQDDPTKLAETLQAFCTKNIFPKYEIQSLELTGHSVLSGLLDYYIKFIFKGSKDYKKRALGLISNSLIKAAFLENNLTEDKIFSDQKEYLKTFDSLSDYYKLRIIVDFISGMTDQYALNHYQKLSGQKIS